MKEKALSILSFLKIYSSKQYKSIEKCESNEEKKYMTDGSNAGKEARAAFTCLVESIKDRHGLNYDKITQWQNSGTFVSYFWCQMKRIEHKESIPVMNKNEV